ncbi:hypothetical protein ANANG_G00248730 [Anguilla anguilla]|uniref:Uncharacterized protein n=1 Tax=Anguilla anguilla TaxID=7936 RepID=A0A9D3LUH1_ANGAN|nr:hypothetical protein ANANG_G00248730 [Anguilla anguilla]
MVHRRHRVRYYRQCGYSELIVCCTTAGHSSDITFEISRLPTNILQTGQGIDVCGDDRSDSPGHNAKYTTYSMMEDSTKRVIHFELVQIL